MTSQKPHGGASDGRYASHRRRRIALAVIEVVLVVGGIAALLRAGPSSVIPTSSATAAGKLYFTTFRPPTVDQVTFSYHAGHLRLSNPVVVARLPASDGVLFAPDGRLLIGAVRTGKVIFVNPSNGSATSISAGVPASMHLALSPDGKTLYTSGEPGTLAVLSLSPVQPGHEVPLNGATTTVTAIAFGPGGEVLYTKSPPAGGGEIGRLDLSTGTTTALFTNVVGAHGILYDPWSNSFLVVGGDVVIQLGASDPSHIESEIVLRGNSFDQAAVTGRGQVLIASNLGSLVLIDYSKTGRIGNTANTVIQQHLARNLDDVAPLIGPGARPVTTSAHTVREAGVAGLGLSALILIASLFFWALALRRRQPSRTRGQSSLPRWDRRRRVSG